MTDAKPPTDSIAEAGSGVGSWTHSPTAAESVHANRDSASPTLVNTYAALEALYPEHLAGRPRDHQLQLIERGRQQALVYGFDTPELTMKFLYCVVLLDNDLSKPSNSDVAYVLDTLAVPGKTKEKRLERALNLSRRIAEQNQKERKAQALIASQKIERPPVVSADNGPSEAEISDISVEPLMSISLLPDEMAPPDSPTLSLATEEGAPPTNQPVSAISLPAESIGMAPTAPLPPPSALPQGSPSKDSRSVANVQPSAGPALDNGRDVGGVPQIEGFRIIEAIASGGMGTVYRARDVQLDIDVAIKVLRSLQPDAQKQFLLEARAAAKLQHPNIVSVLRYEQYGQGGYCVMQLVKGTDAHRLIRRFAENAAHEQEAHRILEIAGLDAASLTPELRGLLRDEQPYYRFVACWMAGIAEALDRAHAEGIIHYDVKPNNIMLASDGRLMLGDFGLATIAGRQNGLREPSCVGTPGYLSPEMLAGWACGTGMVGTDARVDIWGIGATMYEFLTFRPAYEGPLEKVLRAIATTDPQKPAEVVWHTPAELQRICLKAMARNPDERYQRISEMADDLRQFSLHAGRLPTNATRPASGPFSWLKRPKGSE